MGLRWYVPLPGPFHVSGGWISGLIMIMIWMAYVMIVLAVYAMVLLVAMVAIGVKLGVRAWEQHKASPAAPRPKAESTSWKAELPRSPISSWKAEPPKKVDDPQIPPKIY